MNMSAVTKNKTYGSIAGLWVITQKSLLGEDIWKSLRRTTDDDDGRQVIAIAHLALIEIIAQCYLRKKNHVQ
jgi:hypothetical protein